METISKEMMKQYVESQKFTSTTEIMSAMKSMFRDVLQQVMERELDVELDYEKSERQSENDADLVSGSHLRGLSQCSTALH